jgi:hypothetical protein
MSIILLLAGFSVILKKGDPVGVNIKNKFIMRNRFLIKLRGDWIGI